VFSPFISKALTPARKADVGQPKQEVAPHLPASHPDEADVAANLRNSARVYLQAHPSFSLGLLSLYTIAAHQRALPERLFSGLQRAEQATEHLGQ